MSVQNTTGAAAAWAAWAAQQQAQQAQTAGSGGIFAVPGEGVGNAAAAAGSGKPSAAGQGLLQYIFGDAADGAAPSAGTVGAQDPADDLLSGVQQAGQALMAHALESYAAQGAPPVPGDPATPGTSLLA